MELTWKMAEVKSDIQACRQAGSCLGWPVETLFGLWFGVRVKRRQRTNGNAPAGCHRNRVDYGKVNMYVRGWVAVGTGRPASRDEVNMEG